MDDHAEDPTSWRDDLRVERVHQFISEAVSAAEVAEVDLPHVVICHDDESGAVSYSGPFRDGLAALVHAERESAIDRALNDGQLLRFEVVVLYPVDQAEPV